MKKRLDGKALKEEKKRLREEYEQNNKVVKANKKMIKQIREDIKMKKKIIGMQVKKEDFKIKMNHMKVDNPMMFNEPVKAFEVEGFLDLCTQWNITEIEESEMKKVRLLKEQNAFDSACNEKINEILKQNEEIPKRNEVIEKQFKSWGVKL